jgi:ferredoxin-NADP reductase/ferredoxin
MIKLRVLNQQDPTQLREVELNPETMLNKECLLGRNPASGLVLKSDEVSRMHGKIFLQDGQYYFADLASSGGSWLNDANVKVNQGYPLKAGDIIRIGGYALIVVATGNEPTQVGLAKPQPPATAVGNGNVALAPVQPEPPPQTRDPKEYMPLATVEPTEIGRWKKGELTVRCVRTIDETVDAKTFCFVADPPVLFTYKPGQFVTLELEINGEEVSRSYSISSTPSRPHTLEITIKRVPPPPDANPDVPRGLVSNWLHDNVKAGSVVKLSGALGKFTCFANPSPKLLFISAGSGITPMMSMSRWILDTASECDIVFLHSARSPRDIIFRQELEMMSARYPNFRLAVTTTRAEPGESWMGLTGRLNPTMLQMVAANFKERTVYVCGPNTFMEGVHDMLEGMGFPMQNYYEESFGPPRKKKQSKPIETKQAPPVTPPPSPGGIKELFNNWPVSAPPTPAAVGNGGAVAPAPVAPPPTPASSGSTSLAVVFAKAGKEVAADGELTILELADENGVKIRSSCRAGNCGTCKKKKLEGDVKMEGDDPEALEDSERQEGYILTCVSYPRGRVVVDA